MNAYPHASLALAVSIVIVLMTSCAYAPATSRFEPCDYHSLEPWESPDPDHEGISDAVIIVSVVALAMLMIAFDQGWLTPHF